MRLDQSLVGARSSFLPPWLGEYRRQAFDAFEKLDMPRESEEVWRYLDLGFDLGDYETVEGPGDELVAVDPIGDQLGDRERSLMIDGYLQRSGSGAMSLEGALGSNPESVQRALEEGIPIDLDIFAAAHHAFSPDLAHLVSPPGSVGAHYIDVQASTPARASFPHVVVDVGENAETSVVIGYRSADETELLVVPDLDISLGAGANCSLSVIQTWGDQTRAVSHVRARLGRDSSLTLAEAGLGAALSRLHLTIDLEGPGSEVSVLGLYFGERNQVLDYRAFINHVGRSTTSDMLLKGAVADRARSVFTGLIKIWKHAARARAFQTNRNLVLSEGAQAQSVPTLEILCDDVMCGHASASGPLDADQLYYLRSRGLPRSRAERMLMGAFFNQVLKRFPVSAVAGPVRAELSRKFMAAQSEGRL